MHDAPKQASDWRSPETDEAETITKETSAVGPLQPRACVSVRVSLVCVLREHYVTFEWCNAVPERISCWWQKSTSDSPELRLHPLRNGQSHAPQLRVGWRLNVSQWGFFFFLIQWIIFFDPLYLFAKSAHVEWASHFDLVLLFAVIKLFKL